MNRRRFLKTTGALSAAATLNPFATNGVATSRGLVDVNVSLSRWPFRRLPLDDTRSLVAKLRANGVTQAWAGSFDALFHHDITAANARLAAECRSHGRGVLTPFGSLNLRARDWEEEFARCGKEHKMQGLRLHPNYHGYKLDDAAVVDLLALAHEHDVVVQIALSMEDERMQNPNGRFPHADAAPLLRTLKAVPRARVVLLNWFRPVKADLIKPLAEAGVHFDIATLEGVGGVANLLKDVPADQIVFGSHTPLFYFESALLKLKESALSEASEQSIRAGSARRLLNP
jgi:predicted TIM-barrel fold metal-dependent hydrolase